MFDNLTNKIESAFAYFNKITRLDEKQADEGLRKIRQALLESDVALSVTKKFIDNLREGKVSRRSFVKGMGAAGVLGLTSGLVPATNAFASTGRAFVWGGYDDDGLFGPYVEAHGSPEYSTFGDAEEGLQKLKAGFEVDVAWPCQGEIARWVRAGVIQPLDTSRLENWGDMFPEVRDLPSGIVNGQNYFAPVDWGDTSIVYNTDKVTWMQPGNESLYLLEDPRMKGKVGVLDSAADSLFLMMHYLGTDIKDINQLNKAAIDQGINWNETSWETGYPMMRPVEGTMTWACGLAIATGANLDVAYDMINAATSAETSAYLLSEWGYGHSNQKGFGSLTADELAERGVSPNPAEHLANGAFSVMPPDDVTDYMEAQWAEMTAGG